MSFWNASLYLKETFKVYWWWFPILCSRYKEFFKKKYTVLGDDLNCYFLALCHHLLDDFLSLRLLGFSCIFWSLSFLSVAPCSSFPWGQHWHLMFLPVERTPWQSPCTEWAALLSGGCLTLSQPGHLLNKHRLPTVQSINTCDKAQDFSVWTLQSKWLLNNITPFGNILLGMKFSKQGILKFAFLTISSEK